MNIRLHYVSPQFVTVESESVWLSYFSSSEEALCNSREIQVISGGLIGVYSNHGNS